MHIVDLRIIVVAAVAVTAVGVAGCGSSNSNGVASYAATVDSICASVNASVAALPATDASTVSGVRARVALFESGVTKIRRQSPPGSLKSKVNVWLATLSRETALLNKILALTAAGQISQAQALAPTGKALDSKGDSEANAIGLTKCGTAVAASASTTAGTSAGTTRANAPITQPLKQVRELLQRAYTQAGIPPQEVTRLISCLASADPACKARVIREFRHAENIGSCTLAAGTNITKLDACLARYS